MTLDTRSLPDAPNSPLRDTPLMPHPYIPLTDDDRDAMLATVESVKAAAEVYLPVAGTVTAVNDALPSTPEQINSDPYGAAWMVRIKITSPAELSTLLDAAGYAAYCQERAT